MSLYLRRGIALLALLWTGSCCAAGGPLGIDHRLAYDNSGIWKRNIQLDLVDGLIAGEAACALWQGGGNRLGRSCWQAVDSSVLGAVAATALKYTFRRERPAQTSSPNQWFGNRNDQSFPSGEVTAVTSIITPFVLEYGRDDPAAYALELLPVYDGIARMKTQGHWQTDVLAGFALGTLTGYLAHQRQTPFILGLLPHGFMVGLREEF